MPSSSRLKSRFKRLHFLFPFKCISISVGQLTKESSFWTRLSTDFTNSSKMPCVGFNDGPWVAGACFFGSGAIESTGEIGKEASGLQLHLPTLACNWTDGALSFMPWAWMNTSLVARIFPGPHWCYWQEVNVLRQVNILGASGRLGYQWQKLPASDAASYPIPPTHEQRELKQEVKGSDPRMS